MSAARKSEGNRSQQTRLTDQIGKAALLRDLDIRDLLSLVNLGTVLDLSLPISMRSPRMQGMSPYVICLWQNPVQSRRALERFEGAINGVAFADERVEMDLHTGTHIDALGHAWEQGVGYGGVTVEEAVDSTGLVELGIEHLPPLIARGVFIDVPHVLGRPLEPGEIIRAEALEMALRGRGTAIGPGDIVLIRTGWGSFYTTDPAVYANSWPGIGLDAAKLLTSRNVLAVGSDNIALEAYPDERPGELSPVHLELLVRSGTYIIEQANLEPLAEHGATEFVCMCLAPRFVGATASPVRLTALL